MSLSELLRNTGKLLQKPQGQRTLRTGMAGMDVARVQNQLNAKLLNSTPPLWVDGIFGSKTDMRVREFQRRNHLVVDGLVGPATRGALESKP